MSLLSDMFESRDDASDASSGERDSESAISMPSASAVGSLLYLVTNCTTESKTARCAPSKYSFFRKGTTRRVYSSLCRRFRSIVVCIVVSANAIVSIIKCVLNHVYEDVADVVLKVYIFLELLRDVGILIRHVKGVR